MAVKMRFYLSTAATAAEQYDDFTTLEPVTGNSKVAFAGHRHPAAFAQTLLSFFATPRKKPKITLPTFSI